MIKNKQNRLYISPPSVTQHEIDSVVKTLESNWIATTGEQIDLFENKIEDYLGEGVNVVALNSGTSAIHLGLKILGVTNGDEVMVQSNTHIASVNPVLYLGATPVFVDSEEHTFNISPFFLEKAIEDRLANGVKPKAIIAVDLYGTPFNVGEVKNISTKYNIPILEDAAEALGSKYKGGKCGNFGEIGVFSFNGNKIVSTTAGGALILKNKELKQKALYYSNQAKLDFPYFEHSELGYNYRMTNIAASFGLAQMERLKQLVDVRMRNHQFYLDLVSQYDGVSVYHAQEEYSSNNWLSFILIESSIISVETIREAFEKENIETRRMWKPMHLQPLFKKYHYFGDTVSQNLFERGLCLPSGTLLTDENKLRIKKVFDSFFDIKV